MHKLHLPECACQNGRARLNPAPCRLWNGSDLKHARTVANGSSWITDCTYTPLSRRMVFTSMDRAISTYDMNRLVCKDTSNVLLQHMAVPLPLSPSPTHWPIPSPPLTPMVRAAGARMT